MNSSKRWIIPTAIAAGVAVLGWMFIGLDKRAQQYEMEHDDVAAFEDDLSPVDRIEPELSDDAVGTESSGGEATPWSPKRLDGEVKKDIAKALEGIRRPGKRRDSMSTLERLAAMGYHEAMLEIGRAFMDAKFSTYSPDKAYAWLTVAQAFGSSAAEDLRNSVAAKMEAEELQEAHAHAGKLLSNLKKRISENG